MKPSDRYSWIESSLQERTRLAGFAERVNVLDRNFVDAYASATGAQTFLMPFGADKCPQLGRDLSAMFKLGVLKRYPLGLGSGDASMGFPKWVYSYQLARSC